MAQCIVVGVVDVEDVRKVVVVVIESQLDEVLPVVALLVSLVAVRIAVVFVADVVLVASHRAMLEMAELAVPSLMGYHIEYSTSRAL